MLSQLLISTAYFPPISWIAAICNAQNIQIEIFETYPKQTYRNRCYIGTASGILKLSVPVIRTNGNHTKTLDILIDNSGKWQQLHWRSIITCYNKSPYFLYYRDYLEPIFNKKHISLIELNQEILNTLLMILNLQSILIENTSKYDLQTTLMDFRNIFKAKGYPNQTIIPSIPRYMQVFEETTGFLTDLSILDLIFNLGPESKDYITGIEIVV